MSTPSSSRPPSITRSVRDSFTSTMQVLPPEIENFSISGDDDEEVVVDNDAESPINELSLRDTISSAEDFEGSVSHNSSGKVKDVKYEDEVERKIKKGLKKIKILDKILLSKIEYEKEVKKERKQLEKSFLKQVERLVAEKGVENVVGYQQLLSLCAPVDRSDSCIDEDDRISQIFATQIDPGFYQDKKPMEIKSPDIKEDSVSEDITDHNLQKKKVNKGKKDFIKRNIKLASQGSEYVHLTNDERQRLEELLADNADLLVVENPFSKTSNEPTDGFCYSIEDKKVIENIDEKLKYFLSETEYEALLSESQSTISLSGKSTLNNKENVDKTNDPDTVTEKDTEFGEEVLRDMHNQRTMAQRLYDIEAKLKALRTNSEDVEETIDPDLLRQLLDGNSRLTSQSKTPCDSFRTDSNLCFSDIDTFDAQSITSQSLVIESIDDDNLTPTPRTVDASV